MELPFQFLGFHVVEILSLLQIRCVSPFLWFTRVHEVKPDTPNVENDSVVGRPVSVIQITILDGQGYANGPRAAYDFRGTLVYLTENVF